MVALARDRKLAPYVASPTCALCPNQGILDERSRTGIPAYRVAIKVAKNSLLQTHHRGKHHGKHHGTGHHGGHHGGHHSGGSGEHLLGDEPEDQGQGAAAAAAAAAREDLLKEALLMAQFSHKNIVALIGVVTKNQRCQVIMQFCDKGSLDALLRADAFNHKGDIYIPSHRALASKKSGNIFRVGIFLDFVRRTTRAEGPHGAHARGAKRNRIDHWRAHGSFHRAFAGHRL